MIRNRSIGLGACLVVAMLVAGCAASAAETAGPAATVAGGAAPTWFTGHSRCMEDDAASPTEDGAMAGLCIQTATDARLSGTPTGPVHFEFDGDAVTMWSTSTLTNDGGSWACKDFGFGRENPFVSRGGIGSYDSICIGQGGYKGLTAYSHGITGDSSLSWSFFGWIVESP